MLAGQDPKFDDYDLDDKIYYLLMYVYRTMES